MPTSYRDNKYIFTEAGSPYANYALVCQTTMNTLNGSWATLPRIFKSTFSDKTDLPSKQDEANDTIYLQGGKREASFELDISNQDTGSKEFYNDQRGLLHCILKQEHNMADPTDGKYQFMIIPNAWVVPEYSHSAPGNDYKITYKPQKTQALMTLDLTAACTGMDKTLTCTTFVVPANTLKIYYRE